MERGRRMRGRGRWRRSKGVMDYHGGSEGKGQRDMNSYSSHLVCGLASDMDMVAVSVTLHALRKTRHEGILDM